MTIRSSVLAAATAAAVLAPAAPAYAAWAHDPRVNTPVGNQQSYEQESVAISDGAGGIIVAWSDLRNGNFDIYAQRLDQAGRRLWGANDLALCTFSGDQTVPAIVTDNAGGAFVAWQDFRNGGTSDVFIQRVNAAGATQWGANGVPVTIAAGNQQNVVLSTSPSGSVHLAWLDFRAGNPDLYMAAYHASGTRLTPVNGAPVCVLASTQGPPAAVVDEYGNLNVFWEDERTDGGDIYGQSLNAAGAPALAVNGVALVALANEQAQPVAVTDRNLGTIVAWLDDRAGVGQRDVYVQRFYGGFTTAWPAGGVALCTAVQQSLQLGLVADNFAGAIAFWKDTRDAPNGDLYAQKVDMSGNVYWRPDGAPVCLVSSSQDRPRAAADEIGGVTFAWSDDRPGPGLWDVYAQHLDANGDPTWWFPPGQPVGTAIQAQTAPTVVSDGVLGAIIVFGDTRSGPTKAYAQRVDRWGYLGAEPVIASVRDVPNDQGGKVKVSWNASPLDVDPLFYNIGDYILFRSVPPSIAASALRRGAVTRSVDEAVADGPGGGKLLAMPTAANTIYWEAIDVHGGWHLPGYSLIASTLADSSASGNPKTLFMVMARGFGNEFWPSEPDSGYSADNVPPAAPVPFTGQYQGAVTRLHWNPNGEPDIAGYELHRGSSTSFTPGPANLVASQPDTGYVDVIGSPYYYKLAAFDTHGNLSGYSLVTPSGTTGVISEFVGTLGLAPPRPNPAHGAALFTYRLSRDGVADLAILDVSGRVVRQLTSGPQTLADHTARWDGTDAAGHEAAPGVYFVRLAAEGRILMHRFAFVR